TDITGTRALGNLGSGVSIYGYYGTATSSNTIGGTTAGSANVISANGFFGVLFYGAGVNDNLVPGNPVCTDITGTQAPGNAPGGVGIERGASGNTIGGVTAAAGNLITKNDGPGVTVGTSPTDLSIGNQITANRIFGNSGPAIDLGSGVGVMDNGP